MLKVTINVERVLIKVMHFTLICAFGAFMLWAISWPVNYFDRMVHTKVMEWIVIAIGMGVHVAICAKMYTVFDMIVEHLFAKYWGRIERRILRLTGYFKETGV